MCLLTVWVDCSPSIASWLAAVQLLAFLGSGSYGKAGIFHSTLWTWRDSVSNDLYFLWSLGNPAGNLGNLQEITFYTAKTTLHYELIIKKLGPNVHHGLLSNHNVHINPAIFRTDFSKHLSEKEKSSYRGCIWDTSNKKGKKQLLGMDIANYFKEKTNQMEICCATNKHKLSSLWYQFFIVVFYPWLLSAGEGQCSSIIPLRAVGSWSFPISGFVPD